MRFKIAVFILGAFAIAQLAKTVTLFILPNAKQDIFVPQTQNKSFFSSFSSSMGSEVAKNISAFTLNGIFLDASGGFVLFHDGSKQIMLDVGKAYNGYTLEKLSANKATFSLDSVQYALTLEKSQALEPMHMSKQQTAQLFSNQTELISQIDVTQAQNGVVITRLKNGSLFEKMGLVKDDVLQNINGANIASVADLTAIFPKLQNTSEIKIKLQRNNQEKELSYAVK